MARLLLLLCLLFALPASADEPVVVGRAWQWLEMGRTTEARAELQRLLATEEGARTAEVYYGLAAVAWEERDARAAWQALVAAHRGAAESSTWNPGPDGVWQRRIDERLRYLQERFTVVRLDPAPRGDSLPPLADPPPRDPEIAAFCDAVPKLLERHLEEHPGEPLWMLLPNGSWWIGDHLEWHGGGGLESTEAGEPWQLVEDDDEAAEAYEERVEALKSGHSLARALIKKLMIARTAPQPMVQAELARQEAEKRASAYARRGGQLLLTWDEVTAGEYGDVARSLGEVWSAPTWHLRAAVVFPDKRSRWELALPDLGLRVRIDRGGVISVLGKRSGKQKEDLREVWTLGDTPNRIDLWFDGERLKIAANGRAIGPLDVAMGSPGRMRWALTTNDDEARMLDVRVEEFPGFDR